MTDELFRQDAYLTEAPARVVACDARGILLDRTVFYARGGGQAGDSGTLVREDGSAIAISDTVKGDGQILHVAAAPHEPRAV
jgi:misacylated tRNA(Ala) deacylase